jgi:hypothetical protein
MASKDARRALISRALGVRRTVLNQQQAMIMSAITKGDTHGEIL